MRYQARERADLVSGQQFQFCHSSFELLRPFDRSPDQSRRPGRHSPFRHRVRDGPGHPGRPVATAGFSPVDLARAREVRYF